MEGETILCISTRRWDSLWRSTQQIMSRMAEKNRVIFFEPGRNPDAPVVSEFNRNLRYFFKIQVSEVIDNVFVVPTPSSLPHARGLLPSFILRLTMPLIIKINAWIEIWHIRRVMRALDIKSPILWVFSPYQIDFIGKFNEKIVCCHNYDEYANFTQNNHIQDWIRKLDIDFCRRVDVIFTTSRSQRQNRITLNENTHFIPNGVDFNLFNKALASDTPIALDIESLKKPVIGYVGWLGYQIDVDLLLKIALEYSESSLVLVGPDVLPDSINSRRLRALDNVHFLGQKKIDDLPKYLKAIDVALIPYLLEGYVLTAYPLKLHEYLAAGRAVVSTALPELSPYKNVVSISDSHNDFIIQIRKALNDYDPSTINERVALAREYTWDNRVKDIYKVMHPLLLQKEAGNSIKNMESYFE